MVPSWTVRLREVGRELGQIGRRGRQVWRLVPSRHRWALGGALLVMFLASAGGTAIAVGTGMLVDSVDPRNTAGLSREAILRSAAFYLALIGLAYLTRESMNVLRRYLVENTCTRINRDMTVRLVGHLMKVDLSTLAQDQVGGLYGRINRSSEGFVRFLRISFLDFVPALMTGAMAISAVLTKQPKVALVMAGVIPISLALTICQLITQKGIRLDLLRTRERMDGTVVELLSGIDYVRAANTHRRETRRVARTAERMRSKEIRHHFEMSLFGSGKALNEGFFHLLVLGFAVYLFVGGQIAFGDIVAFSILYLNVMCPLNEVHRFIDEAHESSIRIGDLVDLLRTPADRSFRPAEPREPVLALGRPLFTADGLTVAYPGRGDRARPALDDLDMTIRHGETIGVAGRSGCGKTTWLRALMRLVHPTGGSATLGGVSLESVSRESIGRLIGYVGQNPFVFSGTIEANIAYGTKGATPESIREAARLACIDDEIMGMPGGYKARVAERGQNLSGGQRQRLALARVFLRNPPILILDEGTSALDNISEKRIQQAIDAARGRHTVILVAHRLTTLLDTDRILVFEDGRVVESGRYGELLQKDGAFAELVRSAGGNVQEAEPFAPAAEGEHGLDHEFDLAVGGPLEFAFEHEHDEEPELALAHG
ncbi:Putative multidrug export ATP-binding/permease protein [Aquisphaera giovannonii]|uniref:Multidrug export ATP-binding/permease protein n=1 Tax=Aquisphaera giovannonii TaxID=406548 RepID=A0A5B9WF63_9BACT|nr:ABC transporter ATP-binding protein [Aquisphaera giovannonii]QEH38874.1 Putative multidrug export ATP-binding/permease protein [Aquisphaera giovannonii]